MTENVKQRLYCWSRGRVLEVGTITGDGNFKKDVGKLTE